MGLPDELRQAAGHLRDHDPDAARAILTAFLQRNPSSDLAWLLLSYASQDSKEQRDCVVRALRLNPTNERARRRLEELTNAGGRAPMAGVPAAGEAEAREPSRPEPAQEPGKEDQPAIPDWARPSSEPAHPLGTTSAPPSRAPSAAAPPGAARRMPFLGRNGSPAAEASQVAAVPKFRRASPLPAVLGILALCLLAGGGAAAGYTALQRMRAEQARSTATARAEAAHAVATSGAQTLPASWTPRLTPTVTLTPTPSATPVPTATPSPIPPDPTSLAEMEVIRSQVSDLRGLAVQSPATAYLLSRVRVRPILEGYFYATGGSREEVDDEARVLVALGLIKPTYELFNNTLNSLTDSLGGFYFHQTDEVFIIGSKFSGIERWIYSHEFDHALVDQHYDLGSLGIYPQCVGDEDRCRAIRALVEGDATLLMTQWLSQYASPQDYEDLLLYNPPSQTLPDQFPPPYAIRDGQFPYLEGLAFVKTLHESGSWAEVNRTYQSLPASTEQILHPEKYQRLEEPVQVSLRPLDEVMRDGWRQLDSNTMGEWITYLLLAYGADLESQLDEVTAATAAEGWGGDGYQVYYHDDRAQTVLVAQWTWDSALDADQFEQAMITYLEARFRGAGIEREGGTCWEVNEEVTCLYVRGVENLWLLSPDQTTLDSLLSQYPSFQ